MARLIEKENVSAYGGEIVYLETHFDSGDGFVEITDFSYRLNTDGTESLHTVELFGFDGHDEYDMDEYGVTWRLWDIYVETPSVQQMAGEPWEAP